MYVDNGSSVSVFDRNGALVQMLGAGMLEGGMGVAVDSKTGDVFVVDGSQDEVDVFEPEPALTPVVEDLSAQNVTPSEVEVSALGRSEGVGHALLLPIRHGRLRKRTLGLHGRAGGAWKRSRFGFGAQKVSVTLQGLRAGHHLLLPGAGEQRARGG